ncbi:MAG TPA: phosphatase PAP2 family protein [Acidimicrobiales bacterium]
MSDGEPFGTAVARLDTAADQALDRVRGHRVADIVLHSASHLGDWSVLWHLAGTIRGLTSDANALDAYRLSALLGAESLLVNQGIKRLFSRSRPDRDTWTGGVRIPSTSSFPSGHASSAFFAATLLSTGRPRQAPALFVLASLVALSRPYTRVHHASDAVGGAAIGLALGLAARPFLRRR